MIKVWHSIIVLLATFIIMSLYFDDNYLLLRQDTLQRQILNPNVNKMIYNYLEYYKYNRFILTNYLLPYLPDMDTHSEYIDMSTDKEFFDKIKMAHITDILLSPISTSKAINYHIKDKLNSGEYKIFGHIKGYYLIGIK